jgi:hypothetical protein
VIGEAFAAAAIFGLAFGASVPCDAPPGTVVARLLPSGSNGNPISYQIIAGDRADFRIRGTVLVVGLAGIDPTHCGSNRSVSVTATQQ